MSAADSTFEIVLTFAASGEIVLLWRLPLGEWRQRPAPPESVEPLAWLRTVLLMDGREIVAEPEEDGLLDPAGPLDEGTPRVEALLVGARDIELGRGS